MIRFAEEKNLREKRGKIFVSLSEFDPARERD
jgi:hypothetical protein